MEGLRYLATVLDNSVDLILTDPPYCISRESGMNTHYNTVRENEENNVEFVKTETEWEAYKTAHDIDDDSNRENYLKYGTIYGKKFCVKTSYGEWDSSFTLETLDSFVEQFYKKLKKSGTLVIFFDLWKISELKDIMEKHNFKHIRFIEWIKTNPQPRNSKLNYLTNCREIALVGVKGDTPTFHSEANPFQQTGIYSFPLQGGKNRFHPTQKSLPLFEALIQRHSNEGDVVLDTFLGSGTTALAALNTKRKFRGCEGSEEYFKKLIQVLTACYPQSIQTSQQEG